jgi:hypothetical protein
METSPETQDQEDHVTLQEVSPRDQGRGKREELATIAATRVILSRIVSWREEKIMVEGLSARKS